MYVFLDIKFHYYVIMINFGKLQEITFYDKKKEKIPFSMVFLLTIAIIQMWIHLKNKHLTPTWK